MKRALPLIALSATLLASAQSIAQTPVTNWPSKPVRIVIPFTAGGPLDALTRAYTDPMSRKFGQPFLIENKPGAGGNIGSDQVSKSAPDGYTFLFTTTAIAISPSYYKSLAYNVEKDLAPVSLVCLSATVLGAGNKFAGNTIADLIRLAKASPGKITFGSSGVGTTNHLSGELLKSLAGIDILHVPFGGAAAALTSMVGGQTDLIFASSVELASRIKAGQIKGLAVTNAQRTPALPDIPTIGETVPGYESTIWYGLFAPAAVSKDIIAKLSAELVPQVNNLEVKQKFDAFGTVLMVSRPEVLATKVRDEIAKWRKVIPAANIVPE